MLAKQVSRDREIFCTTEMSLTEVFKRMTESDCDCMPVVESPAHMNIIGTITEHDICMKIINDGLHPQRVSAGRILNGNFTSVSAEATTEECAELLKLSGAARLFVVDENGAFMGILTEKELIPERRAVKLETVITDLPHPAAALPQKVHLVF